MFIAIYNDQGPTSRYWTLVKRLYNKNGALRMLMIVLHASYLSGLRWLVHAASSRRALDRGMSLWRDMIDRLGGYPFEVVRPDRVFRFFRDHGFRFEELKACGGRMGCNEFVFGCDAGDDTSLRGTTSR